MKDLIDGQMSQTERRALHDAVREARPRRAFEVGTWRGGGSTLQIATALHEAGYGTLYTSETDSRLHHEARTAYARHYPYLLERIQFLLGASTDVFPPLLIESHGSADFVFLDGAEDADQSWRELQMFEPHVPSGAVLCMHDWYTEKARLVKPYIESSPLWRIEYVLAGNDSSVGFVKAVRV